MIEFKLRQFEDTSIYLWVEDFDNPEEIYIFLKEMELNMKETRCQNI